MTRSNALIKKLLESIGKNQSLSKHERKICVHYLTIETNQSPYEIADLLGVSYWTVHRDQQELASINAKLMDLSAVEDIIKQFVWKGRITQSKALKNGDLKLYWDIEKDILDRLGKVGYIPYQNEKISIKNITNPTPCSDNESLFSDMSQDELIEESKNIIQKIQQSISALEESSKAC